MCQYDQNLMRGTNKCLVIFYSSTLGALGVDSYSQPVRMTHESRTLFSEHSYRKTVVGETSHLMLFSPPTLSQHSRAL